MNLREILEIGFGGNPLGIADWHPEGNGGFITTKKNLQLLSQNLPEHVRYVGVDHTHRFSPEELATSSKWLRSYIGRARAMLEFYDHHAAEFPSISLFEMDSRNLSFEDQRFNEIHLYYVLSDPSVAIGDSQSILSQARRVLVPGGILIVLGEKYWLNNESNRIVDRESQAENIIKESGFAIKSEPDALEKASCIGSLSRNLYEFRCRGVDRSGGFDSGAYLFIAKLESKLL